MKLKVGVQLFSVMTELANDYLKTLENVAKAGYKYVEYVDVPGNSPEARKCPLSIRIRTHRRSKKNWKFPMNARR